jgi:signal transduction histidine kinase
MSIRLRLIIWYSTVFAAGLIGFAVVVWVGTRAVIRNDIDSWLTRQSAGFEEFLRKETHGSGQAAVIEETREFSTGLPRGSGVQLFDRTGKLLFTRPEMSFGSITEQPSTVISDRAPVRALTRRVGVAGEEFQFVLWRSLDESEAALDDLRLVLFLMVPAFLLASFAGGWFLSRRALRPVDEITKAARQISLQSFPSSLPIPQHRDELQRLCEAWNEMLHRLEGSAQKLRQFTADASHELRTPVALIRTTAELTLRQDRSAEEYRLSLQKIQEDAMELTVVIESLMDLTRADSGQSGFAHLPLDFRELASEIQPQFDPIRSEKNLDLEVQLPPEQVSVIGDRGALRRLLMVLLDNAIKFTVAPGRITLRVRKTSSEMVLEVEDSGIGISEQDIPRVFDRFYQVDGSRSGGGVGLGLSIAQWIVQGHNGRIEVHSTLGHGSLFRVFLPIAMDGSTVKP